MSDNIFADKFQQTLNLGENDYIKSLLENNISSKLKLKKKENKDSHKTGRKLNPLNEDEKEECIQKINDLHLMSSEPLK